MNGTKLTNNLPKVTVVTVTYNAEKYLESTIKSVIEQDYSDVEYIIIDGASTDGTIDIIKKYEKYIDYWISEPDKGIYDAMNKGIDVATGEWINFMNAGDTFASSDVFKYMMLNVNCDTDMITGDRYSVLEDNVNRKVFNKARGVEGIEQYGMPSGHQSMFIKTSLMKKYKYSLMYQYAADHELMLRFYDDKVKIQLVDKVISCYLRGGFSDINNHEVYIEILSLMIKFKPNNFNLQESNVYRDFVYYFPPVQLQDSATLLFSKQFNRIYDQYIDFCSKYKRIILYGNGKISDCLSHIHSDHIVGIIDKQHSTKMVPDVEVYHPDALKQLKYDAILITVLGREDEIISFLQSLSISKEKIIVFTLNSRL